MSLMRTYLYFWITASVALYASAFAAMAAPITPHAAQMLPLCAPMVAAGMG